MRTTLFIELEFWHLPANAEDRVENFWWVLELHSCIKPILPRTSAHPSRKRCDLWNELNRACQLEMWSFQNRDNSQSLWIVIHRGQCVAQSKDGFILFIHFGVAILTVYTLVIHLILHQNLGFWFYKKKCRSIYCFTQFWKLLFFELKKR